LVLGIAWLLGKILGHLTRSAIQLTTRRTTAKWDDRVIEVVGDPIGWLWIILISFLLLGELHLPGPALSLAHTLLRLATLIVFFWMLLRLVTIAGRSAQSSVWATTRPSMRALVPLGVRIGRVAVAAIALVAVLADLGYPVASLVAGLGIGGLAIALAAQKTVENLFGAFAISIDQPFSVGDTITAEGVTGEVEAIGLRSTRIRTADRTVVTIPNGKLADMRVECFAGRDRIRLGCLLSLVYGTSSTQLRAVVAGVEALLRAEPKIFPNDVVVRLRALAAESLEIEVNAWLLTADFGEFRTLRQDLLLGFIEVVERAGTALALPTRTVHLVRGGAGFGAGAKP
jgi:MscS family membrane protein